MASDGAALAYQVSIWNPLLLPSVPCRRSLLVNAVLLVLSTPVSDANTESLPELIPKF